MDAKDWSRQTVLVTGAAGFIGSHLAERLASLGARTRAFVHYSSTGSRGWLEGSELKDEIEVFYGDIREAGTLRRAMKGVDVVFHLAALVSIPYSYHAPVSFVRTNVEGTLNMLQEALETEVDLVVHTSTSEVYGTARRVPIGEGHVLQGQSPYSASKVGADKMAEAFHLSHGLPVTTIRPFNTYGPRQSPRAVIPAITIQALASNSVRLGNLRPTRDFNFVADTVDAFVRIAGCPEAVGQVIHIGSGREISIGDLARKILAEVGRDVPLVSQEERVRPRGSEVERLLADNTRARDLLGWEPRHSLEEGLRLTIDWIRDNLESYRADAYAI